LYYKRLIRLRLCFNAGQRTLTPSLPKEAGASLPKLNNLDLIHRTMAHGRDLWRAVNERAGGPNVAALKSEADYPARRSQSPKRVLIVEDNLDSVHSLVLLLQDMGHHVDYAINGYAALALAKRMRPDFVLLDLGLPGIDGFDVCKRIKGDPVLQSARIIAVTGYRQEEYRVKSKAAGCEIHLIKPVDPKVFEQILN
jgi:CheY-like chemotaxis protein